ncbi:MAG TPA: hypothetical protein VFS27_05900 [Blastocatellia bacterium]|jgi:hypothetical protein|nr:hypothetical protein [Blastocatellia bacterium]
MKHNQEAQSEGAYRLPVNCFRCSEGCVHLEYGNIIFTFTPPQFRALAEVIGKVYGEMESERAEQEFSHYNKSLVM